MSGIGSTFEFMEFPQFRLCLDVMRVCDIVCLNSQSEGRLTSRSSSQSSNDAGGMPQSTVLGIGGGNSSLRISCRSSTS